jgi:hypothetical protein
MNILIVILFTVASLNAHVIFDHIKQDSSAKMNAIPREKRQISEEKKEDESETLDISLRKERTITEAENLIWCERNDHCSYIRQFDIVRNYGTINCEEKHLQISFGAYTKNNTKFDDNMTGFMTSERGLLIQTQQQKSENCLKIKRYLNSLLKKNRSFYIQSNILLRV